MRKHRELVEDLVTGEEPPLWGPKDKKPLKRDRSAPMTIERTKDPTGKPKTKTPCTHCTARGERSFFVEMNRYYFKDHMSRWLMCPTCGAAGHPKTPYEGGKPPEGVQII